MWGSIVLALQAAASAAGPPLPQARLPRFTARCERDDGDEVVVCGNRDDPDRLKPLPPRYTVPTLPKAETRLFGNVRAAAEGEATRLGPPAAMIRLKIPF